MSDVVYFYVQSFYLQIWEMILIDPEEKKERKKKKHCAFSPIFPLFL